jgi:hypothetical protein
LANRFIEQLRNRIPYIRRLQRRVDELQHRLATLEATPAVHAAYGTQTDEVDSDFRTFLRLLQPHDASGVAKRRFGGEQDGGYVMLDDFGAARIALSFGVGNDVSWDADMAARGLRVLQFDHTVQGPPQQHANFVFQRTRVVGASPQQGDTTLDRILAADGEGDVIAKMDVEGFEWEILAQAPSASLARLRQIALEFHDVRSFGDRAWRDKALAALTNLNKTHVCVHIHGNNWGTFAVVGGIPFPEAFEATFARRSDHTFEPSTASLPTDLDRPCNPRVPDLHLGRWSY